LPAAVPTAGMLVDGRFVLETELGSGGMGVVWQARHSTLGSRVAIKFLRLPLVTRGDIFARFLNEATCMARLQSRYVVRVYDFGISDDGWPYLVMEYVDGETLKIKCFRESRLSPSTAVRLLYQAARGLERAHRMGIAHCDFKPDNVLLSLNDDGQLEAQVADFGVATFLFEISQQIPVIEKEEMRKGTVHRCVGTIPYMAPEQLLGATSLGPATDIWSFGIVAYECLTGALPFPATNPAEYLETIRHRKVTNPCELNPDLPAEFLTWFERCCAYQSEKRFLTIRDAADALVALFGMQTQPNEFQSLSGISLSPAFSTSFPASPKAEKVLSVQSVQSDRRWGSTAVVPALLLCLVVMPWLVHKTWFAQAEPLLSRSQTASAALGVPPQNDVLEGENRKQKRRVHRETQHHLTRIAHPQPTAIPSCKETEAHHEASVPQTVPTWHSHQPKRNTTLSSYHPDPYAP
jgi:eukaryotic-like serine/threonine-protein kinase